jgi:hypothetical protein
VSVSLFGSRRKYLSGAEKLIRSISKNLPDWEVVFFTGKTVPEWTIQRLAELGARIVHINDKEDLSATAWRFRISHFSYANCVIFRDSDSIISLREAKAIKQWLDSGLGAHIIRDHPFHSSKILAGLWGLRPDSAPWFETEVNAFNFENTYGSDQDFLAKYVYPKILSSCLIHASFHKHEHSSTQAKFESGSSRFGKFCGESVTENILIRAYARFRRLVDSKLCECNRQG